MFDPEEEPVPYVFWNFAWSTPGSRPLLPVECQRELESFVRDACIRIQAVSGYVETKKDGVLFSAGRPFWEDAGAFGRKVKAQSETYLLRLFPTLRKSLHGGPLWEDGLLCLPESMAGGGIRADHYLQSRRRLCQPRQADAVRKFPYLERGKLPMDEAWAGMLSSRPVPLSRLSS